MFSHRVATRADIPAITALMDASIAINMAAFLDDDEVQASRESMGVDDTLIDDGTYFVVESDLGDRKILVGCGGWGKRKTLYGGNATTGRDDEFSDPATDAARIRAMYTHPDWVRMGIGTLLLDLGENAARQAGFRTIELGSTIPGEPLYRKRGYEEISRETLAAANGSTSTIIKMRKTL